MKKEYEEYLKVLAVFDSKTESELTEKKDGVGIKLMPSFT